MVFSNVLTRALSLDSLLCLSSACCSSSLFSSLQVSACSAVHCSSAATEAVLRLSNAVNACVRACVLRLLLLLRLQLLLSTTANSFRTETLAVLLSNALAPPAPRQALLLLLLIVVNCCYIANTASARPQRPFVGEWLCKQAA